MRFAPILDHGREDFPGAGLATELRQVVKQMELGHVAAGKFCV